MTKEQLEIALNELSDFSVFKYKKQLSYVRYSFKNGKVTRNGNPFCDYTIDETENYFNIRPLKGIIAPINYEVKIPDCSKTVIFNYDKQRHKANPFRHEDAEYGFFVLKSIGKYLGDSATEQ